MSKTVILLKNQIRAYVSDLTDVANEAIKRHQTSPLASLALGTGIAALGPLGVMKKYGKTIATVKGNGPLKNIVVESNVFGDIRALVGNPGVVTEYDQGKRLNEIPIELGVGHEGTFKIVNEVNGKTFGGEVKLAKGDIVTDLAYYFDQSEQIFSAVQTSVLLASKTKLKRAYAVIFQMLPKHNEADVALVEDLIKNKPLANFKTIDDYIKAINFDVLETNKLVWKCSCSRAKIKEVLKAISKEEQATIIKEHGHLEVKCNFCNTVYDFTNEK